MAEARLLRGQGHDVFVSRHLFSRWQVRAWHAACAHHNNVLSYVDIYQIYIFTAKKLSGAVGKKHLELCWLQTGVYAVESWRSNTTIRCLDRFHIFPMDTPSDRSSLQLTPITSTSASVITPGMASSTHTKLYTSFDNLECR